MVFSSAAFLFAFLPAFLFFYAAFSAHRNLVLLAFSLLFYFIGEGYFLLVMLASIALNYAIGLALSAASTKRKYWLVLGIIGNLGLLVFYKYFEFLLHSVFGFQRTEWTGSIHLPLGISFFTFQGLSYIVDVYRRDANVEKSLVRLATYIAMFPQLIAGPIVRFGSISQRLLRRTINAKQVYFGALFFIVGLAEKVLIADTLANIADAVFATPPAELSAAAAWLGGVAYGFQIFYDFSGYSSMAIGLGLALGFQFPRNFNFPYIAQSITEFWRRWHLSLSEWFRDYLYIPLGGNRRTLAMTYRNLVLVFLLTGLWHGAAWTFIVWGAWHGAFMLLERAGFAAWLSRVWPGVRIAYALLVVYIGWIIFRAPNLEHASALIWQHVFADQGGLSAFAFLNNEKILTLIAAGLFCTPVVMCSSRAIMATTEYGAWQQDHAAWKYVTGTLIAGLLFAAAAIKVLSGAHSPFIYFRF